MEVAKEIILGSPWWVYVLFVYILMIGIKGRKDSKVPITVLCIIPGFFTVWSLWEISAQNLLLQPVFLTFLLGAVVGSFIGYYMYKPITFIFDQAKAVLEVKGSWRFLIMLLCLFGGKFTFGVINAMHPELLQDQTYQIIYLAGEGALNGLFIGRVVLSFILLKQK